MSSPQLNATALFGDPGTGTTSLIFRLLTQYRNSARTAFVLRNWCPSISSGNCWPCLLKAKQLKVSRNLAMHGECF
jgi:hypothetical protein